MTGNQELVVGCGGGDGRESLEVRDEEGRGGKLLVLPGEPQLVAAIPCQRVEVGEEGGLLHFLPEERVEGGQGGLVSVVDVSRPDLKFVIFSPQMYFWAQFFST